MYYLNGEPLRLDKAFTDTDGNQYPANWLRSSTQEQRDALGITWVAPDPAAYYDQRFYWGVGNPKQLDDGTDENGNFTTGLKSLWVSQQKQAAGTLLAPTDWYVIRMTEDPECMCPPAVVQYRSDVRTVSGQREDQILACVDVEELEALITAPAQIVDEETGETQANPAALIAWPEQA